MRSLLSLLLLISSSRAVLLASACIADVRCEPPAVADAPSAAALRAASLCEAAADAASEDGAAAAADGARALCARAAALLDAAAPRSAPRWVDATAPPALVAVHVVSASSSSAASSTPAQDEPDRDLWDVLLASDFLREAAVLHCAPAPLAGARERATAEQLRALAQLQAQGGDALPTALASLPPAALAALADVQLPGLLASPLLRARPQAQGAQPAAGQPDGARWRLRSGAPSTRELQQQLELADGWTHVAFVPLVGALEVEARRANLSAPGSQLLRLRVPAAWTNATVCVAPESAMEELPRIPLDVDLVATHLMDVPGQEAGRGGRASRSLLALASTSDRAGAAASDACCAVYTAAAESAGCPPQHQSAPMAPAPETLWPGELLLIPARHLQSGRVALRAPASLAATGTNSTLANEAPLWLELRVQVSALLLQPAEAAVPAHVSAAEAAELFASDSAGASSSGSDASLAPLSRPQEALLRSWLVTPAVVTLRELLSPASPQAPLPAAAETDGGAVPLRRRLLARRAQAAAGLLQDADDAPPPELPPRLPMEPRSSGGSRGTRGAAQQQQCTAASPVQLQLGELLLARQLLQSAWRAHNNSGPVVSDLAVRWPQSVRSGEPVAASVAAAVPPALLSWDVVSSQSSLPPPAGVIILASFVAGAHPPSSRLASSRPLESALGITTLAGELARTTVHRIDALLRAGQAMLAGEPVEARTRAVPAAALAAIRPVSLNSSNVDTSSRSAPGSLRALAQSAADAAAESSRAARRVLRVTGLPHPGELAAAAAAATDDSAAAAGAASPSASVSWNFIAHVHAIAKALADANHTAALATRLAGAAAAAAAVPHHEQQLLRAFTDDAHAFGLEPALAGLALHLDLTRWADSISDAARLLPPADAELAAGADPRDAAARSMQQPLGARAAAVLAAFRRGIACALEQRAPLKGGSSESAATSADDAERQWLLRLLQMVGVGEAPAGAPTCDGPLAAAGGAAFYIPLRAEPAREAPPAPAAIRRLIAAGALAAVVPPHDELACDASASTSSLRRRLAVSSLRLNASTSTGAAAAAGSPMLLPLQCAHLDSLLGALPPRLLERLTAAGAALTLRVAAVSSDGRISSFTPSDDAMAAPLLLPLSARHQQTPPLIRAPPRIATHPAAGSAVEMTWRCCGDDGETREAPILGFAIARADVITAAAAAAAAAGTAAVWRDVLVFPAATAVACDGGRSVDRRRGGAWLSRRCRGAAIAGLPPNSTVAFRVAAVTASGMGAWSPPSQRVHTPAAVPAAASPTGLYRTTAFISPGGIIKAVRLSGQRASTAPAGGARPVAAHLTGQSAFSWEAHLRWLAEGAVAAEFPSASATTAKAVADVATFHAALAIVYARLAAASGTAARHTTAMLALEGENTTLPTAPQRFAQLRVSLAPDAGAEEPTNASTVAPLQGLIERSGAADDLQLQLTRWLASSSLCAMARPAASATANWALVEADDTACAAVLRHWTAAVNASAADVDRRAASLLAARSDCCDEAPTGSALQPRDCPALDAAALLPLAGVGGIAIYGAARARLVRALARQLPVTACAEPRAAAAPAALLHSPRYAALAALATARGPAGVAALFEASVEALQRRGDGRQRRASAAGEQDSTSALGAAAAPHQLRLSLSLARGVLELRLPADSARGAVRSEAGDEDGGQLRMPLWASAASLAVAASGSAGDSEAWDVATSMLVASEPLDGACEAATAASPHAASPAERARCLPRNARRFAGAAVLLERGGLPLAEKVARAAQAGAAAVIIADDAAGRCGGSAGGSDGGADVFGERCTPGCAAARGEGWGCRDAPARWAALHVPAVLITHADGQRLLRVAEAVEAAAVEVSEERPGPSGGGRSYEESDADI